MYDLNQIPYDYTVEVRNRFKGLDLIEYLMNYGWKLVTLYSRQGSRPSPRKINAKKAKWLSEEDLQIAVKRREVKSKGGKEIYTPFECRVPPKLPASKIKHIFFSTSLVSLLAFEKQAV